jgi:hypothetical protein
MPNTERQSSPYSSPPSQFAVFAMTLPDAAILVLSQKPIKAIVKVFLSFDEEDECCQLD